ncbi:MAG: GAF domain-containing protein [Alphaproteobacteria bacterium]|nr:GAF domain-containing protein [Alphaproteobacteria bacterium]
MPHDYLEDIGLFSLDRTPVFDRVVEAARSLFVSKISLISFVDEPNDRQFFKAATGLPLPWSQVRQTPLSHSLCLFVVAHDAPLMIADARQDARFNAHDAVTCLGVVSYLGVPIRNAAGKAIAALCVIDTRERAWTPDDAELLEALAEGVTSQIRLMLEARKAGRTGWSQGGPSGVAATGSADMPSATLTYFQAPDGHEKIDFASDACDSIWEVAAADFKTSFSNLFAMCLPGDLTKARASLGNAAARLTLWQHEWRITTPSGAVKWLSGSAHPETTPGGGFKWSTIVRDVTDRVHALGTPPDVMPT